MRFSVSILDGLRTHRLELMGQDNQRQRGLPLAVLLQMMTGILLCDGADGGLEALNRTSGGQGEVSVEAMDRIEEGIEHRLPLLLCGGGTKTNFNNDAILLHKAERRVKEWLE